MAKRVGRNEKSPTHHVLLTDRDGTSVGLILCNDKGEPSPQWVKAPVQRTALKTTSGTGSYADYNSPYSPIVQDNYSGGRGSRDFERDTTRFFDAFRVNTHREGLAILGPKEHYTTGHSTYIPPTNGARNSYTVPTASFDGTFLYYSQQFTPTASFTTGRLMVKFQALQGTIIYVDLYDAAGTTLLTSGNFISADAESIIGKWHTSDLTYPLVSGTTYTLKLYTLYVVGQTTFWWQETADSGGVYLTSPTNAFAFLPDPTNTSVIFYQYRGQQYKVINSATGGAPTVWMNGDRGAADSNAGNLNKVIDATKTWTVNQWAGCTVKIIEGTGIAEKQLYRTIMSNTATELVCDMDWTIQQDTTTGYVILGASTWRELTGHGLTTRVTDVLSMPEAGSGVSNMYFAQGDSVLIRNHREYNNAGTWVETDYAAEAAGSYATFLAYQPLSNKIWRAQNRDATNLTSVSSATPTGYAATLTFSAVISVGNPLHLINGIEVYPSDGGTEALWVFKEELAYIVTTQAEGIKLDEMKNVKGRSSGAASIVHNVYLYFSLGKGLERYYGGNIEDLGPNLDEGLPDGRDGEIIQMIGYPGRVFAVVDAGTTGESSLIERSGGGWHEVYRAPAGERLKAAMIQVIPGDANIDRMWLHQGNITIWLPLPSNGTREMADTAYRYTSDGAIILGRMHAGLYDIQKIARLIKLWSAGLEVYGSSDIVTELKHRFYIDYRVDDDEDWTIGNQNSYGNVTQMQDTFGLAGKSIQLRIRFHSWRDDETPQLQAVVMDAVARTEVKYTYSFNFRLADDEPTLAPREMDDDSITAAGKSAMTKLQILENWSDATTTGLLYMTAASDLYNRKYVFINPPVTRQIAADASTERPWTGAAYICQMTAQEA